MRRSVEIAGVFVDRLGFDQALERIDQLLERPGFHYVVTVNPEFIVAAQRLSDFKNVLNRADLRTADGVGLQVAAEYLAGRPSFFRLGFFLLKLLFSPRSFSIIREPIRGSKLVFPIAKIAAKREARLLLFGGSQQVAESSAKLLRRQNPDLDVRSLGGVAVKDSGEIDRKAFERLSGLGAKIAFVALGSPKQELFIDRYGRLLGWRLAIGVGGSLDYLSGKALRPPKLMAENLEWLWRLMTQPRRLNRILTATLRFLKLVYRLKK